MQKIELLLSARLSIHHPGAAVSHRRDLRLLDGSPVQQKSSGSVEETGALFSRAR
jgi:hypothetical protein